MYRTSANFNFNMVTLSKYLVLTYQSRELSAVKACHQHEFGCFSLNYELTVEALEHSAHSSWHSHESSIQVLPP